MYIVNRWQTVLANFTVISPLRMSWGKGKRPVDAQNQLCSLLLLCWTSEDPQGLVQPVCVSRQE